MYHLIYTIRFKKDVKRLKKRGYDMDPLKQVIIDLEKNGQLSQLYQPHKLSGNMKGYWEAHLKGDWLIIWKLAENKKEIWLTRTGTHSDLF